MTQFAYDSITADEARIGLIVLSADESLERDMRDLIPLRVNLLTSRVPSGDAVTEETLGAMAEALPAAARLLPQAQRFATVGYGCTSGAAVIGRAEVERLVAGSVPTDTVTNPVSALVAAAQALGLRRLAILSPYVAAVSERLRSALLSEGIETPLFGTFNEAAEEKVVRIAPHSIIAASRALMASGGADALFLSCTNLRTLGVIAPLEEALGLPVLSSNQVLAWHMLRLAGIDDQRSDLGQLFAQH
ncbi:Arylmalonate decarboxylase [Roseivivax sp. THAF40]|uniref:maleate cis-trans isomerase family protein n=1 Tax=unclassified Roseivivax TaxID=2639302 RepID=UPI001269219C|nr:MULTISPECIES: aspartate/glutamate racemase family protein [unclassified Roseivivax]QFS84239.1 Arylmalonate decarboxylase [Roseivivax sp. THAF197b]QFT48067.1 Arylmalonate decarboxylase [Roseivivax sp. THAF40]